MQRVLLFGELHDISLSKTIIKNTYAIIESKELKIFVSINDKSFSIKKFITGYLKELARNYLNERTKFFAEIIGINYNNIFIKDQKTRWGSCSSIGNINYNYRIILSPKSVIDYLVVHELCHIRVMGHSKKFWNLVESVIPLYHFERRWLRQNASMLII